MEIIRKLKVEDFESIMNIFEETDFGCTGLNDIYKPGKQTQSFMMREILRGDSSEELLVIEIDGTIKGYVIVQNFDDSFWHISQIAVDQNNRNKGYGRKLMNKVQGLAKKSNKDIKLECFDKDNHFFTKQGFEIENEDDVLTYYVWKHERTLEHNLDEADER